MKKKLFLLLNLFIFLTAGINAQNPDQSIYIDFGLDNDNGRITVGPDTNSNYWNNQTEINASETTWALVNSENNPTGYNLQVTGTFQANGRNAGGLANPDKELLGDLAIDTATEDYFFVFGSTVGSIKIKNLNRSKIYKIYAFGTRSTEAERISIFTFNGLNEYKQELQTSGTGIGREGHPDGNVENLVISNMITPNQNGEISINLSVKTGEHAYMALLKIEEYSYDDQQWTMRQAPLMTEWAEQVDPENPWPEYPRPQMVRSEWMNLNGVWDLGKNKAKQHIIHTAKEDANSLWQYITGDENFTVADGWNNQLNYDETDWSEGAAGFGHNAGVVRTEWTSETIYLRKKVTLGNLTQNEISKLKLEIFHDEDFEVYINGILAASGTDYITSYKEFEVSEAAKAAIKPGEENLIAIKCIQTTGGQYIDAGLFVDNEALPYGQYYANQNYDKKILVPFPIESAISGVMDTDYDDITKWYSYRRSFSIPENMKGKEILLHFGAVDWRSFVFVNGEKVGEHEGGFDPFSFNITNYLKESGDNELVVQVYDPSAAGGQPYGKQHNTPGGIFYTPATGIWQTVWLESVNSTYITDFRITPDIDNDKAIFNVKAENATGAIVKITILDGETEIASTEGNVNTDIELAIANPKLWDTENPFLYDVKFELTNGATTVDEVQSYFGMRKISVATIKGTPWMVLNDKPVFQFGTLDQGYWPDGVFTAPNEEALLSDIIRTKELGFNMIRKHIKTEPARWYYACDKMGMLVWQDIPNGYEDGNLGDYAYKQEIFKTEMQSIMNNLINYPSIIVWTIFNEAWGQYNWDTTHVEASLAMAKEIDNTRIMNATSGWTDVNMGDLFDRHSYPDVSLFWDGKRPSFCGESGGFSLVVEGHTWDGNQFVYESVENNEALKNRFIEYVNRAKTLQISGLTGVVYTQITDVEAECNGLITYDRLMKNTPEQIAAIKAALEDIQQNIYVPIIKSVNSVIETGAWDKPGTGPSEEWNYVMGEPAGDWTSLDYEDVSWNTGKSGFGRPEGAEWDNEKMVAGTEWICDQCDIYLRKVVKLDLTDEEINQLKLHIFYDDKVEVYFNGVLAFEGPKFIEDYEIVEINQAAKDALNPNGENVIAVHCYQDWFGQYIDLGLFYGANITAIEIDPSEDAEPTSFVLEDKVPFSNANTVENANVKFTRNGLEADEYSTLYLPFATTLENIEVYAFKNSTENKIVFAKVNSIEANVPYLIKPNADINLVIEEESVTVEATTAESTVGDSNYIFSGSYYNMPATSGMYGISPNTNSFVQAGDNVTVPAFRAYLKAINPASGAPSLAIGIDGDTTDMSISSADGLTIYVSGNLLYIASDAQTTATIHAIDGRLVRSEKIEAGINILTGLQQGVYVVNGQKVVIR